MNLVIDIGNSLTKLAIVENDNVVFSNRYEVFTLEILTNILTKYMPQTGIVSVVGNLDVDIIEYLRTQITLVEFNHKTQLPIVIHYKTPQTLGLDRIAAAVGANYLYPKTDLLVIDCGTAITYDVVDQKGEYFGGAISPGIMLRYKSLHQHTANLPLLTSIETPNIIGASTTECIESGVLNGVLGEVDHFINSVKEKYPTVKVIITGGDSNFFASKLKNSIFVVQNIVTIGLNRILDFNV